MKFVGLFILETIGTCVTVAVLVEVVRIIWWAVTGFPPVLGSRLARLFNRKPAPQSFRDEVVGSMSENTRNGIWAVRCAAMFFTPFLVLRTLETMNAHTPASGFRFVLFAFLATYLFLTTFAMTAPCYRRIVTVLGGIFMAIMWPQVGSYVPIATSTVPLPLGGWVIAFQVVGLVAAFATAHWFDRRQKAAPGDGIGLLEIHPS